MTTRRGFLIGMLGAAPAIVRAESLMRLRPSGLMVYPEGLVLTAPAGDAFAIRLWAKKLFTDALREAELSTRLHENLIGSGRALDRVHVGLRCLA